jgi:L-ascorbate metabolism protein UlaG (beta-lactamase superfamily)
MKNLNLLILLIVMNTNVIAQFEKDVFPTSKGDLTITFIGHGTLMMEFDRKVIHVDPVGQYADYTKLPKADLVLVTHHHGDHFDVPAIEKLRKPGMTVVLTAPCKLKFQEGEVLKNGDSGDYAGIRIEAVPAYNIKHERGPGMPYHPKGEGNGYILRLKDLSVYVAGDSENTPEMKALKGIDIAFLPMNLPYTMTPEMVVDAVRSFKPKVLYPYHLGDTDTGILVDLMKNEPQTEVRIRKLE